MAQISDRVKCSACGEVNPGGLAACRKCGAPLPVVRVQASQPDQPAPSAPEPRPQDALQAVFFKRGQVVANRYTVLEMIGRGGMGCIYKVHDNVLKEEVALKTLLPQFVKDKMVVERFYNEARIARNLSHPNIVRVHDIGMAGAILYISMEFLPGRSMRAMLDSLSPGTRLDVSEVLRLFEELCGALEYAHQFTVHRDLKPENVMIAKDGAVKLMDFGISKLVTNPGMTATSVIMGTPHYMSPEQLRDSASVDARADIYSLGVMLYEVMTGNVPVGVPKPASQITREVPQLIDDIIARCLDPAPANRYPSANDLRVELRKVRNLVGGGKSGGTSLAALKKGRPDAIPGEEIEGPARWPGLALIAVVLAAMVGGLVWAEGRWSGEAANGSAPAADSPVAARFKHLESMIGQTLAKAKPLAGENPGLLAALAEGEELWDTALRLDQNGAGAEALEYATSALRAYAVPLIRPEGMVYVPGGEVTLRDESAATAVLRVDGFFIDEREVTRGQFEHFVTHVPGGWTLPPGFSSAPSELPVTNVAVYDAMAYAAYVGKALPTEAQWARAAYGLRKEPAEDAADVPEDLFPWGPEWAEAAANAGTRTPAPVGSFQEDVSLFGMRDAVGNVAEWTITQAEAIPYGDPANDFAEAGIGDWMCLRGGDFVSRPMPLWMRRSLVFESRDPAVGFRCVQPLPQSLDAITAALAGAIER